ncbi:MAG: hypothetical protein IT252_08895 [Chitinophagaceae bacterium]|nr:hypothetical protein [Chitinophagaceae bacterium]
MAMVHHIQFLKHADIDFAKWDYCIHSASNGLVYALSGYLHCICPQWDALVMGDYEAVMPLPQKKKWGIAYLYQPWGLAQGGIFSRHLLTAEIEAAFYNAATQHFKYGTFDGNETHGLRNTPKTKITWRNNFVLPLSRPYETLYNQYDKDAQKNIRRANRYQQFVCNSVTVEEVAALYTAQYGQLNPLAHTAQMQRMIAAGNWLLAQGFGFVQAVRDANTNSLLCAGLFGFYRSRIYYILGAPTTDGRNQQSVYLMLDSVIAAYATKASLFDFEGSDIPNVASFYSKFGSINKPYPCVHFNRLPWPINKLKS